MRSLLEQACEQGEIRPLDLHIGLFLEKQARKADAPNNPDLLLAAALASTAVGSGHVCLPLDRKQALPLKLEPDRLPEPTRWRRNLLATSAVGRPGETAPLILDPQNRLYLYRLYRCEEFIARDLRRRAEKIHQVDPEEARDLLDQLFPDTGAVQGDDPDLQRTAAALALLKPLLIISGGPGTGKTYTVARILALIQALHSKGRRRPLRIALAAPTGKAAARLEESIRRAKQTIPAAQAAAVPEQAKTLHRLLGARPGADDFRYNRDNPLYLDLLVLDEASMIDMALMAALLRALPAHTRLILLGDRHQLASVEAGSLFGDLCGNNEPGWSPRICEQMQRLNGKDKAYALPQAEGEGRGAMADSLVLLRTGYRFRENSGIGSLAGAVNSGSMKAVDKVTAEDFSDLQVRYCGGGEREQWLHEQILQGFRAMVGAASLEQGFAAMERFRFLCAVRKGPAGTEGINSTATKVLRRAGLIRGRDTDWYQGRPIIILRNQYDLQLFNGDTGILWRDEQGRLRAWFRRSNNSLYPVTPARLPEHDTAYAVTVHKAQGSEFDRVLLLLPEEDSRVLSRELLYTGITRARSRLILCADRDILALAVRQRTMRYSGLREKLHQNRAAE